VVRYRLLETTRAYAREKLGAAGEADAVARRHAEYHRALVERAEAEWETRPSAEWLAVYAHQVDDFRAALDWAFSPTGDASVGVALTAAAVPLWFRQSPTIECRHRFERALGALGAGTGGDARREMQLRAALGLSLMHTGAPAADTIAAWTTALEIDERLGDAEYQLRPLWGLWLCHVGRGECRRALELAERFCERAKDAPDLHVGERMIGTSLHYLGDQTNARRRLEDMLSRYVAPARRAHAIRFQYDQRLIARMILARILWLQGFPDQAMRTAHRNVEEARGSQSRPLAVRRAGGSLSRLDLERRLRRCGTLGGDAA
jgi:hypothetical protein